MNLDPGHSGTIFARPKSVSFSAAGRSAVLHVAVHEDRVAIMQVRQRAQQVRAQPLGVMGSGQSAVCGPSKPQAGRAGPSRSESTEGRVKQEDGDGGLG